MNNEFEVESIGIVESNIQPVFSKVKALDAAFASKFVYEHWERLSWKDQQGLPVEPDKILLSSKRIPYFILT